MAVLPFHPLYFPWFNPLCPNYHIAAVENVTLCDICFECNWIGLVALTFFEFICANVAKLARKRYLVHDICQSTLILACIDAHPNAPYSPNEVDFEKKGKKNLLWPHIAEILHYHYGKSSNYFLNINPNWHEAGHFPPLVICGSDLW